jgi:hypothetical protein
MENLRFEYDIDIIDDINFSSLKVQLLFYYNGSKYLLYDMISNGSFYKINYSSEYSIITHSLGDSWHHYTFIEFSEVLNNFLHP